MRRCVVEWVTPDVSNECTVFIISGQDFHGENSYVRKVENHLPNGAVVSRKTWIHSNLIVCYSYGYNKDKTYENKLHYQQIFISVSEELGIPASFHIIYEFICQTSEAKVRYSNSALQLACFNAQFLCLTFTQ
jgi:hypothetical protein